MSHMVHNKDKQALMEEVRRLEAEGYVCAYVTPNWNQFGQCWIMMMEKPKDGMG